MLSLRVSIFSTSPRLNTTQIETDTLLTNLDNFYIYSVRYLQQRRDINITLLAACQPLADICVINQRHGGDIRTVFLFGL